MGGAPELASVQRRALVRLRGLPTLPSDGVASKLAHQSLLAFIAARSSLF